MDMNLATQVKGQIDLSSVLWDVTRIPVNL